MIFLALLCALAIICFAIESHLNRVEMAKIRAEFAEERQILLNRIENPKYRPPLTPSEKTADLEKLKELREESEQFGLVGKILE